MRLYHYRCKVPNFGDELNLWLLPKVFPDFFDEDDSWLFLGIGSVLMDVHSEASNKIVYGSGYAGYGSLPHIDEKWHFYCVRGPRTARACNIGLDKVSGDSAIIINRLRKQNQKKLHRCSFMPHWESLARGNWQAVCKAANIHFIDPTKPVEDVLLDIEASEMIVTEAMHGAVVADSLRTPWVPILPFDRAHHMKWFDWAEALEISLSHCSIWPSSLQEAWIKGLHRQGERVSRFTHSFKRGAEIIDSVFIQFAAASLSKAARLEPTLSSSPNLQRCIDRLESNAHQIQLDFARRT